MSRARVDATLTQAAAEALLTRITELAPEANAEALEDLAEALNFVAQAVVSVDTDREGGRRVYAPR